MVHVDSRIGTRPTAESETLLFGGRTAYRLPLRANNSYCVSLCLIQRQVVVDPASPEECAYVGAGRPAVVPTTPRCARPPSGGGVLFAVSGILVAAARGRSANHARIMPALWWWSGHPVLLLPDAITLAGARQLRRSDLCR